MRRAQNGPKSQLAIGVTSLGMNSMLLIGGDSEQEPYEVRMPDR